MLTDSVICYKLFHASACYCCNANNTLIKAIVFRDTTIQTCLPGTQVTVDWLSLIEYLMVTDSYYGTGHVLLAQDHDRIHSKVHISTIVMWYKKTCLSNLNLHNYVKKLQ